MHGMTLKDMPALIHKGLNTSFIGRKIIYYPTLSSTMDEARREAQRGAAEGMVIIAGEQTKGRGRLQREWLSPADNIALSIVLYPDIKALPYLIMISSLAAVRGIEAVTDVKTQIKWPNDILINGKKVCGILVENEIKGNKAAFSIIGIGINISLRRENFPEIAATAVSLDDEIDREVSRADIIRNILVEFERLYLALPEGKTVYEAWRDRLATLGRRVVVTSGNDSFTGIAESVDENGTLLVRLSDGSLSRVVAGDVTLREQRNQ
jgi:BirA family biotin operon repressor/biotin-[acetyl-CoA-carboxylase] ligase